jgi:hypothetical protein
MQKRKSEKFYSPALFSRKFNTITIYPGDTITKESTHAWIWVVIAGMVFLAEKSVCITTIKTDKQKHQQQQQQQQQQQHIVFNSRQGLLYKQDNQTP